MILYNTVRIIISAIVLAIFLIGMKKEIKNAMDDLRKRQEKLRALMTTKEKEK